MFSRRFGRSRHRGDGLGVDPDSALTAFQASPLIAYAERDSLVTLTDTATALPAVDPNYPANTSFGQQWGLNSPSDIDIDAPEAWAAHHRESFHDRGGP